MRRPVAGSSPDALRFSYEDLRTRALSGNRGPGFAVFLHHGMCEWIEVCSSSPVAAAVIEPVAAPTDPQLLPPGMRSEIVSILAGLVLQQRGEATP